MMFAAAGMRTTTVDPGAMKAAAGMVSDPPEPAEIPEPGEVPEEARGVQTTASKALAEDSTW